MGVNNYARCYIGLFSTQSIGIGSFGFSNQLPARHGVGCVLSVCRGDGAQQVQLLSACNSSITVVY